jgi:hypothetical protein
VRLLGRTFRITGTDGGFRFAGMAPGRLTVVVEALGCEPHQSVLTLRADTTVVFTLGERPIPLDTIVAEARTVTLRGVVVERGTGRRVIGADVFVRPVAETETGATGGFTVRRITPGWPLVVQVEALGLKPGHAELAPERDTTIAFELEPDPIGLKLINTQVARIQQRTASAGYARDVVTRAQLLVSLAATPLEVVRSRLRLDIDRVRCVFIDEQFQEQGIKALELYPLDMIYRIESLGRGTMVRVYTERFVQWMIERRVTLGPVVTVPGTGGFICH